ncbi:MAG: tRNA (mnm(5)s(2)U34)-methyltransferase [Bacillota bacterium]
MNKFLNGATDFIHSLIKEKVKSNFLCIDATLGNGYDTLFLLENLKKDGFVFGFDIQKDAIKNTEKLLNTKGKSNYKLIKDSHENFKDYIEKKVDLVVYNLGYLPGGDKSITTKSKSTLKSIKVAMDILKRAGKIFITAYPGHSEGKNELDLIKDFFKTVDQRDFNIAKIDFYNQVNKPPVIFIIEKR